MAEADARATNAPEITVSELSGALKRAIEDRFGYVRVRGEISGYRGPHSSGHAYFSLKDANARLDAVIWRTAFQRLRMKPEEGLEVVATGKLTTFPGKSSYQIVIEALELAGVGALMALLEARRKNLAAEGLFDAARKRKVPFLPMVVGVVTSPTGAVIRDILHQFADRFPVRVVVWPVRVQGETSAAEVAAAIDGFNALPADGNTARPDVLIVARGGGSLEDLMSFNDEAVVRAAARSAIPVIAAVGHETDWTLLDHAADLRAPTPTAAAEFAVPVRADLLAALADLDARGRGAIRRFAQRLRADLRALSRALPGGEAIIAQPRQRLDRAAEALAARVRSGVDQRALRAAGLARRLARHSPRALLAGQRERVRGLIGRLARLGPTLIERPRRAADAAGRAFARETAALARRRGERSEALARLAARMARAFGEREENRRVRLAAAAQMLDAVSYHGVLERGFALVRDDSNRPLRRAAEINAAAPLKSSSPTASSPRSPRTGAGAVRSVEPRRAGRGPGEAQTRPAARWLGGAGNAVLIASLGGKTQDRLGGQFDPGKPNRARAILPQPRIDARKSGDNPLR